MYGIPGWDGTASGFMLGWNATLPPLHKLVLLKFVDAPSTVESCAKWTGLKREETEGIIAKLERDGWLMRWTDADASERVPSPLMQKLIERDGATCRHCGTADDLTIDHIHPRSRGGGNALANLQILCRGCNSRKGARLPGEGGPPDVELTDAYRSLERRLGQT